MNIKRVAPTGFLLIVAVVASVHAASIDVTVNGLSGPWLWQTGGLNSSYAYGLNDQTPPTIITSASGISVAPAQRLTITYLSGTESAAPPGWPFVTAQGDTNAVTNNNPDYLGVGPLPSFYMPVADYPIYLSELVGTFADSSGDIVGLPFPVGLSATATVPSGASQLQLGVNDGLYSDNIGSFDVQISGSTVPEPSAFSLFGFVSIGLLAFSRKCRMFRVVGCTLILSAAPLSAAPLTTLFGTGVAANNANGNPVAFLSIGGIDSHYTILPPSSTTIEPAYAAQPNWLWIGGTLVNGSTPQSEWIAPQVNEENNDPGGDFIYQTAFNLTGFDPSTAAIRGTAFVDNALDDVVLNNSTQTGFLGGSFEPGDSISFSFTGGFVPGINILDFTVNNSNPSPSGLNVAMTGTASIPEPSSLSLLGFASIGLLLSHRHSGRKRSFPAQ